MNPRNPVLALAAGAVLLLAAGCNDAEPTAAHPKGGRHHGSGQGHHGSRAADPGSDPSSGGDDSGTTTIAVYWVGDSPQGPRLFREFRSVPADDPYAEAVDLLTSGQPLDPDYRSLLDGVGVGSVESTGTSYDVSLADDSAAERPSGMSASQARLAVQQLVYTVQAVGQSRAPVDVDRLLGQSGPFTNADFSRTLNLVSVTSPEQGDAVGGSFTASGVASSFEATVPWEVRQGSTVVKRGYATADGWMDKLYPWQVDVDVSDLAPGDYTFVALTDDPSGGEGGGPMSDSKDFTIS